MVCYCDYYWSEYCSLQEVFRKEEEVEVDSEEGDSEEEEDLEGVAEEVSPRVLYTCS